MTKLLAHVVLRLLRVASLVVLAAVGTTMLMRFAPGYFTDEREMDATYAEGARASLEARRAGESSVRDLTQELVHRLTRGDLGISTQYGVPAWDLIEPRVGTTAKLLVSGMGLAWLTASIMALSLSLQRGNAGAGIVTVATCVLLSIPIGAMATACVLSQSGGPLTVLAAILVVRDFKLAYKLLRQTRLAPHLLYARAQGIPGFRIACLYLLSPLTRELLSIGIVSLVTALGAIVPIEVIFDVPGLGQLAWNGAMNRDLPVLLGVTLLMASAVGLASTFVGSAGQEATS